MTSVNHPQKTKLPVSIKRKIVTQLNHFLRIIRPPATLLLPPLFTVPVLDVISSLYTEHPFVAKSTMVSFIIFLLENKAHYLFSDSFTKLSVRGNILIARSG